jgi:hypothetical protein
MWTFSTAHRRLALLLSAIISMVSVGCSDPLIEGDGLRPESRPGIGSLKEGSANINEIGCPDYPSYYFTHLDDTECRKTLPSDRDRSFVCPNVSSTARVYSPVLDRSVSYVQAEANPIVDETALVGMVPDDMRITLILVRRVNGVPHYRYLSNGRQDEVFQPWSSTKFMAVANAGSTLRHLSNGQVGLTAHVDSTPIGDLISIVHNYDERAYTSNGLARWFLNVGTRSQLDRFIHDDWLGRPQHETLGGNYGHPTPDIAYEMTGDDGSITLDGLDGRGPANQLSTFTIAEFLKRLVMHREDPSIAMPNLEWGDVQTLLYGASDSTMYAPNDPQGMEGDTTVYLQSALDMERVEANSQGRWRIFSKLGFGYARGGEFVNAAYGCFPTLDEMGQVVPDWGKEFFIVTQLNGQGRHHDTDERLAQIYQRLVSAVMDGTLK